jgi:hypothetical protein
LLVGFESCPKANGERASANPKASANDRSVLDLFIGINSLFSI